MTAASVPRIHGWGNPLSSSRCLPPSRVRRRGRVEPRPDFWPPPPIKEGYAMTGEQEEAWWGVLLAVLMAVILLGNLLVWRLMGNETASS